MQVINLYHKEFHSKVMLLSFNTLIVLMITLILLHISIYFYSKNVLNDYYQSVNNIEEIQKEKQKKLNLLRESMIFSESKKNKIEFIKERINNKDKYADFLVSQKKQLSYSYYKGLFLIAKNINKDLYITEINFIDGLNELMIKGRSRNINHVTDYLFLIKNSSAFDNSNFGLTETKKNNDGFYDFLIGNDNG